MKCLNTIKTNTVVRSDIPVVSKKSTEVCGDRFESGKSDKGVKDLQKDLKLLDQAKSQINNDIDPQSLWFFKSDNSFFTSFINKYPLFLVLSDEKALPGTHHRSKFSCH